MREQRARARPPSARRARMDREEDVELPKVRLHVRRLGTGPPLFLLHGGPAAGHDYFLPSLEPLGATRELVLFDQRGCGRSGDPVDDRYDLRSLVDDTEQLRRRLGFGPIDLLGHSAGGPLALEHALRYPRAVRRLVLSSTFFSQRQVDRSLEFVRSMAPARVRRVLDRFEQGTRVRASSSGYPEAYAKAVSEAYAPFSFQRRGPEARRVEGLLASLRFSTFRRMWGDRGDFRISGAYEGWNALPYLPRIRTPTLITLGSRDLVSVEDAWNASELLPRARVVVFERSGHYPFLEERAKFLRILSDFLSDRPVRAGR